MRGELMATVKHHACASFGVSGIGKTRLINEMASLRFSIVLTADSAVWSSRRGSRRRTT
jgi:ABC-type molybdate transport system ATPase subunit